MNEPTDQHQAEVVGHISVKPIPFSNKCPEIWFLQMESQFALAKITKAETKYHHVLSSIPIEVAGNLSISANQDYDELKKQILDGLKENKHTLIDKALSAIELGDRRPTQLVNEIKRRFSEIGLPIDDNIVKSRLLSSLPCTIRSALVGHDSASLDQYAAIADSMLAVAGNPVSNFVGAVNADNRHSQSNRYDGNANAPPERYDRNRNAPSERYGNDRQQRQTPRQSFAPRPFFDGQRPRVCNSHIYWGEKARNCRSWCQWPNKPKQILRDNERTPRNSRPSSPSNE